MVSAQDHKAVFDGDKGPNTGGMGAYSPAPVVTEAVLKETQEKVLNPMLKAFQQENISYRGILYAGLMVTKNGVKVIEFNVRFGDPETQVVLPRLESDLVEIINAILDNKLNTINIKWKNESATCVVLASKGYPGDYEKNIPITISKTKDMLLFHAGTSNFNNQLVTSGGRVFGLTALGSTIKESIDNTYQQIINVNFSGMFYRKDIGKKALNR